MSNDKQFQNLNKNKNLFLPHATYPLLVGHGPAPHQLCSRIQNDTIWNNTDLHSREKKIWQTKGWFCELLLEVPHITSALILLAGARNMTKLDLSKKGTPQRAKLRHKVCNHTMQHSDHDNTFHENEGGGKSLQ